MNRCDVFRAALCEAGRVDLAEDIPVNRSGLPKIGPMFDAHPDDIDVIARAACLSFQAFPLAPELGTWPWYDPADLARYARTRAGAVS